MKEERIIPSVEVMQPLESLSTPFLNNFKAHFLDPAHEPRTQSKQGLLLKGNKTSSYVRSVPPVISSVMKTTCSDASFTHESMKFTM